MHLYVFLQYIGDADALQILEDRGELQGLLEGGAPASQ
jgi:hypothetical protein